MRHIKEFFKNPYMAYIWLNSIVETKFVPDKIHLAIYYRAVFGRFPNLDNPKSYNEKLQYLKLHDRKPLYITLVDKYDVKEWVSSKIGDEYVIKNYGVWDSFDQIDFDKLPNKFVLKCTHDSGGVIICTDKRSFDYVNAKRVISKSLKKNYFWNTREWPYKFVKPRIIAEEFIDVEQYVKDKDESRDEINVPADYKVLCFNGTPRLIEYHGGRFTKEQYQQFYDVNWTLTEISQSNTIKYNRNSIYVPKPKNLSRMLELSKVLSDSIPHVRVDWYLFGDYIKFGEMTFYDGAGFTPFDRETDDLLIGSYIEI